MTPEATAGSQPSMLSLILAMLTLTGLGVGAGGLFGFQVLSRLDKPSAGAAQVSTQQHANGVFAAKTSNVNKRKIPLMHVLQGCYLS